MPGAAAWRYSAHGESELKKLVLGVHSVSALSGEQRELGSWGGEGHMSGSLGPDTSLLLVTGQC